MHQPLTKQKPPGTKWVPGGFCVFAACSLLAAGRAFVSYGEAKPVLDGLAGRLPAALARANQAKWAVWARQEDRAIRGRLQQGDLDSMVNLLLLGTSFTKQPRIRMETLTEAAKAGVLRARVDDLVAGILNPGENQRLLLLRRLVEASGVDLTGSDGGRQAGVLVYKNLSRVLEERRKLAERTTSPSSAAVADTPAELLDRSSFFRDRGLSLDTSILPDFLVEQTLRDLKKRGVLREGQVARVAVVGPGLDFIDKNEASAYDYYPPQTLQPFALYDSLVRLGLARAGGLQISVFDISSRIIEHLQGARERARKNDGYVVQLPRDVARPWPADLIAYWNALGDRVGTAVTPIRPPDVFPGLPTRAVRIRPDVVLTCEPTELNIVLERPNPGGAFDLIVATNIFLYYDAFEQALALENAGAALKPGGLLLTNDRLPEVRGGTMSLGGVTEVRYDVPGVNAHDVVGWYQRKP